MSTVSPKIVSPIDLPALVAPPSDRGNGGVLGERFDLIEHVKVKLSVTLGGAEMPLGKLFALSAGDVVTLDREVDAPVDIRMHGKLIARGHLVAAGDRFGVRISEIVSE
ncbi:MAG: FliM/FliN family flagellar motor switch protein [Gammaproteobacteria bacterium]